MAAKLASRGIPHPRRRWGSRFNYQTILGCCLPSPDRMTQRPGLHHRALDGDDARDPKASRRFSTLRHGDGLDRSPASWLWLSLDLLTWPLAWPLAWCPALLALALARHMASFLLSLQCVLPMTLPWLSTESWSRPCANEYPVIVQ